MSGARPILIAIPDTFSGPRVAARCYAEADAGALLALVNAALPALSAWLPGFARPWALDDAHSHIRHSQARWALREAFQCGLFLRETGALIGDMRLRPTDWSIPAFDIAYWLEPSAQGQGYASEAVRLATRVAFEQLGAQRVAICCEPRNTRSRGVAERLGYLYEGCLRNQARAADGGLADLLVFALTPADYRRASASWPDAEPPARE